jgi:hypothetical protein
MNSSNAKARSSTWRTLAAVFVVAVVVNYVWELAQTPLYVGMGDFSEMLWHCFVAALGDGLLVLLIFGVGWAALGRRDWFVRPGARGYALMLAAGLAVAVGVEWAAVRMAGQWAYNDRMPIVPLLGVGLAPVAQMLLLPPLIFKVVAAWQGRAANDADGGNSPER